MNAPPRTVRVLRSSILPIAVIAATLLLAILPSPSAHADVRPHPSLVPEVPAKGYPVILKTPLLPDDRTPRYNRPVSREVYAADQIGRAIVSGGNFAEIQLPGGSVIEQAYFAAWSIDTKQMICQQQFTFNNEILTVAPGPRSGTVYVGGRFSKVSGSDGVVRKRLRIALLDLSSCSVDTTFNAGQVGAKVSEIAQVPGRLFIGGDFQTVGGRPIETVAELDQVTGAVNPAFSFSTVDERSTRVVALAVNPAGTRLVLAGRFGTITRSGVSIPAPTAIIDVSDRTAPALTAHRTTGPIAALPKLQSGAVAPDGSFIALAYGLGTQSDYIYAIATAEAPTSVRWQHFMRDSTFGIAVSNNAVYVAGHFCWPDAGPGPTDVMTAQMGITACTGSRDYADGVWRSHLAALSPTDGTPLPWNPGQKSHRGGTSITVTTRGLLVGYDGERTANRRVGALAFFDLGPGAELP